MSGKNSDAVSTRNYSLYVLLTLQKSSDRENPLSVSQICYKLNIIYTGGSATGHKIDRSTVRRILQEMESIGEALPVRAVMKSDSFAVTGKYVPYEPSDEGKSKNKYYYYDQAFTKEQIQTIRDAMEAYNYLAVEDIAGIIESLTALCPDNYIDKYDKFGNREDKDVKGPQGQVLNNIRLLSDLIKADSFAEITYCNYGMDGELKVRDGYPKLFKPLKLLWGNGYYYCACKKDDLDTPVSLRIDRMTEIKEIKKKEVKPSEAKKYSVSKDVISSKSIYRLKHPVMFGGETLPVRMLVRASDKNGMLNALVDTFGRNIRMRDASPDELNKAFKTLPRRKAKDEKWVMARVEGSFGGMVLFATQYCDNVKVIKPKGVVDETVKRLKEAEKLYS